jgi:hypothetical protein
MVFSMRLSLALVALDGKTLCDRADSFDAYCRERRCSRRVSHWIEPSLVVTSAALIDQNQYLTNEIPQCKFQYPNDSAHAL